jgi:hypothetical protein
MKKIIILWGFLFTVQMAFAQDTSRSAKAIYYGKRARQQFMSENFDSALILNRMAINMDSTLSWIQFNIALTYIMEGKGDPVENYTKALIINEHTANSKQALSNAMNDLDDAQRRYGPLVEYDLVKQVLIDRYNRYP